MIYEYELKLKRLQLMMNWLINGVGRHGIPFYMWRNENLTPEWIEEHYNVNF